MIPRIVGTIQNCEATCESMTDYIERRPDVNTRIKQLKLLRDCADICGLTAKFIARKSAFSNSVAGLCAYICEICGAECAKYPDAESQNCSKICMNCAKECKEFAAMYS